MKKRTRNILIAIAVVAVAAVGVWYAWPRQAEAPFCFDFSHDMQFGDREVAHPVNTGFRGQNGMMYYIPEVPALQEALKLQGFYIDPYEESGGKVYEAAFFGPSTRSAVMAFQRKYGLPETGQVTNDTIDKLHSLYACPPSASTTPSVATSTAASTSAALPQNLKLIAPGK